MKYPRDSQTILILDPSSEHMAWSIMTLKNGVAEITNCGMLYASSSWDLGHRLFYMYKSLKFLVQYFQVDHIITEDFVIPKFRQSGITVIPTINNNLKMLIWELNSSIGSKIDLLEVSTTTWRKNLGISSIPALDKEGQLKFSSSGKQKKDWKEPCRIKVEQYLKIKMPKTILANSNLSPRKLPNDITDCLGIALSEVLRMNYPIIKASKDLFDSPKTIHCVKILYTLRKSD